MDSEYLKNAIGAPLYKGLAELVHVDPNDKVEFLGRWLLKYVADVRKAEEVAETELLLDAADARFADEDRAVEEAQEKRANARAARDQRDADFRNYLRIASDVDEVLQRLCEYLQQRTASTAVYVADYDRTVEEKVEPDEDDGDVEDDEDGDYGDGDAPSKGDGEVAAQEELDEDGNPYPPGTLKYRCVSHNADLDDADDHAYLLGAQLTRARGVTHELFPANNGDGDEDEEEDDDESSTTDKPKPERRLLSIPNVLLGEKAKRIHFHRLPRVGAYLALATNYESLLNEEALSAEKLPTDLLPPVDEDKGTTVEEEDGNYGKTPEESESNSKDSEESGGGSAAADEASAEETTEEEEEPQEEIAPLKTDLMELVVCLDTLGQNREYTDEEIHHSKDFLDLTEEALRRIDREHFLKEYEQRQKFLAADSEAKQNAELSDEEKEKQLAALREELGGDSVADEDVAFKQSQKIVASMRQMISEFKSYAVFKGNLKVLQCIMYMVDYKKEVVADAKNKPVWKKMRQLFNNDLLTKLESYDPTIEQKRTAKSAYAKVKALKKLLKGVTFDDLKEQNFALAQLFNYARTALDAKEAAKKRRQEEEAKRKADEEAAAAAAAEAAAEESAAAEENADGAAEAAASED